MGETPTPQRKFKGSWDVKTPQLDHGGMTPGAGMTPGTMMTPGGMITPAYLENMTPEMI